MTLPRVRHFKPRLLQTPPLREVADHAHRNQLFKRQVPKTSDVLRAIREVVPENIVHLAYDGGLEDAENRAQENTSGRTSAPRLRGTGAQEGWRTVSDRRT